MSEDNEDVILALAGRASRICEGFPSVVQDDGPLENMKRQALFTADAVLLADMVLAVVNDIQIRRGL